MDTIPELDPIPEIDVFSHSPKLEIKEFDNLSLKGVIKKMYFEKTNIRMCVEGYITFTLDKLDDVKFYIHYGLLREYRSIVSQYKTLKFTGSVYRDKGHEMRYMIVKEIKELE